MTKDQKPGNAETKQPSGAAQRALEEAAARRNKQAPPDRAGEVGGRKGPDPTRYGDWEKDGILSDF